MSNSITSAGTAADSDMQPIVTTSASIEANPVLYGVVGEVKFRAFYDGKMVYPTNALSNINRFFRVIREDAILMQYVGFDEIIKEDGFNNEGNWKTKKPIWYGDIVKINADLSFYAGKSYTGSKFVVVKKNGDTFLFPVEWGIERINKEEATNYTAVLPAYKYSNMYNVIGNIYQNPELLETGNNAV